MNVRFFWVTDIPTPYRNHQFERMAELFPPHGIQFRVLFTAWTEVRRPWNFVPEELVYPWTLHKNPLRRLEARAIHINPTLLTSLRRDPVDVVMIGGWASPTPALAAFVTPRRVVKILGCESHLGSVQRTDLVANRVKRAIVHRYDAFLVPGVRSLDLIRALDPSATNKPWVKLPNVIDASVFRDRVASLRPARDALRARLGVPADRQLWFCPARLAPEKGLQELLPLLAGTRNVELLVAGEGPLHDELQALIERERLPARLLGQQPQEKILELYSAADLFALPSLADPSPVSAVEAAAARLPLLLSSRAGNCDDLVSEGVNGWVFDVESGDARRALLEHIAAHSRDELAAMGARSLERYQSEFDSDACIERLAEFVVRLAVTARRSIDRTPSG
jgi:glycosyltransferase involved in cell wall biosynthesis